MADNVGIKGGTDAQIATDDIGGVHYQIIKIAIGADGSVTVLPGDSANGLDVDVTRVQGTVTVNGTDIDIRDLAFATDKVDVSGSDVDVVSLPSIPAGNNNIGDVDIASLPTGTLGNGAQTTVSSTAVQVLASNGNRKGAIIQNVGNYNVRVGVTGVTATTGFLLKPGGEVIFSMPYCPDEAIFAIREGSSDSTVLAMEIT